MEPAPLIGRGLTAEVFAWGGGRALKLFFEGVPLAKVQHEFAATRAVHEAGYPSPAVHEIIQVGSRHGLVMDRVDGASLVEAVERKPWTLFGAARQLADLHARLHAHAAPPTLRTQREQIASWIAEAHDLPKRDRDQALASLPKLPSGEVLCHGDFHPANVLLAAHGPVIIDWSRATRGHPLGDVARTAHLIRFAEVPPDAAPLIEFILRFGRSLLLRTYLKRYFELRPGSAADLALWDPAQEAAASAWRCRQSPEKQLQSV